MSGNKCSYVDCNNSSRNTSGMRKFFFPVKDQKRCKKWILLCGNPSLSHLNDDELKNRFLCDKHFPDEMLDCRKLPPGTLPVDHAEARSPLLSVVRTYSRHSNNRETEVSSKEVSLPDENTGRKSLTPDDSTGGTGMHSKKQREIEKTHLSTLEKQQESLEPARSPSPSIEKAIEIPSSSKCEEKFDKSKLKRNVILGKKVILSTLSIDSSKARPSTLIPVVRTYSKSATSKKTMPTCSPSASVEKAIEIPSSSECGVKFDKGNLGRKVLLRTLPVDPSKARTLRLFPVVRMYSKSKTSKKTTVSSEKTSLPEKSTCCPLSDDSANEADMPIKKKKQLEEIDPHTIQKQTKILKAANPWEQKYIEQIGGLPSTPKHQEKPLPSKSKFLRSVESLPDLPRIIVKMQLNHKPGTPWTPEEEDAAIVLYNESPSMYRFLKEKGFILPSEKTVSR